MIKVNYQIPAYLLFFILIKLYVGANYMMILIKINLLGQNWYGLKYNTEVNMNYFNV
jgi:ABC-type microcin C transport system permease subunit YejB